jgi:hypothetical protein
MASPRYPPSVRTRSNTFYRVPSSDSVLLMRIVSTHHGIYRRQPVSGSVEPPIQGKVLPRAERPPLGTLTPSAIRHIEMCAGRQFLAGTAMPPIQTQISGARLRRVRRPRALCMRWIALFSRGVMVQSHIYLNMVGCLISLFLLGKAADLLGGPLTLRPPARVEIITRINRLRRLRPGHRRACRIP